MPTPIARVAVWAGAWVIVFGSYAGAQTPSPSPTVAPTPSAFSAHAHANVTVTTASGTYGGTAQLGMAQRGSQTRIDVLSLKSDSVPIPPIVVTVVIDRGANTLTAWSDYDETLPRAAVPAAARGGRDAEPARHAAAERDAGAQRLRRAR